MRYKFLFLFALCFLIAGAPSVYAKEKLTREEQESFGHLKPLIYPVVTDQGLHYDHYLTRDFTTPKPPFYPKVKFFKQDPPKSITQRIGRLIYGIYVDIPPEYDHYGYEIRRYMSNVLNPETLNDIEGIDRNISNLKAARIILGYWKKELTAEIKEIEDELASYRGVTKLNTTFRYNKGIVNNFIPDMYNWIRTNIEFLELLKASEGLYLVRYPLYYVKEGYIKEKIDKLHKRREKAWEKIVNYSPFRAMIY